MANTEHETRAVDSLEELGLREYEARCFVALSQLSEGTAKEISKVAGVPRSRVYDSLDQLRDRGLVDIRESNPRVYRGVPTETAIRTLRNEFSSHIETISDSLTELQVSPRRNDDEFWTVTGEENVAERGRELIDDAEREVVIVVQDDDRVVARSIPWIRVALDRGVTTLVRVPSEEIRNHVEQLVPGAQVFVTSRPALGTDRRAIGRTLLVDDAAALLSSIEDDAARETAVLSTGGLGSRLVSLVHEVSSADRGFTDLSESPLAEPGEGLSND
ncbi:TrmB family transcriptional regulator [Halomarina halobia]|uniref:TrmB family transcriptional regulator n=1 Tax=Halomarina halobia TaxID=3033386 RepID=A0ABD6ACM2_9EURY|nr:helix-turn-helix domain-containing protein [Halomarina sp. PSR21]